MTFVNPRGRCSHIALLILLSLTIYLPASAQVLIGGSLYEKLDLKGKISENNAYPGSSEILYDGKYNGPFWSKPSDNNGAIHSYINVVNDRPLSGQVIVKFDTYSDHLPTGIEFYVGNDGKTAGNPVAQIATTSPDAPFMVTFDIPEGDYNSIQMRGHSAEGKEFALRELEVLTEISAPEIVFTSENGTKFEKSGDISGYAIQLNGVQVYKTEPSRNNPDYSFFNFDLGHTIRGKVRILFTTYETNLPDRIDFFAGVNNGTWNNPLYTLNNVQANSKYLVEFEIPEDRLNCNSIQIRPYSQDKIFYLREFEMQTESYYDKLKNLRFTHTHGALSSLNDNAWGYENAPINQTNNWTDPAAANIAENYGVEFPAFNFGGQSKTLQATHERDYDVYVIPGHTVSLIPYSDMHQTAFYGDGYIRWYDYNTDLAVADENFGYHVNPSLMWQIPTVEGDTVGGSLGGVDLLRQFQSRTGLGQAVAAAAPARGCFAQFHVPAGANFNGATVAADFSMSWGLDPNNPSAGRIARANGMMDDSGAALSIIEPAVNCRAVFHIHDGSEFANKLSATAAANADFIAANRRVVAAAPNKEFNIRLDFQEPAQDGYHSNIYYRKEGGSYGRVCRFQVRTFIGEAEAGNQPFEINNGRLAEDGAVEINRVGYITEDAGKPFNRFLHCDPAVAEGGTTYTVKIYGLDEDGKVIRTADGAADLQIMEYVVSFERDGDVSMQEMEDYLKNLDTNGKLLENPDAANLPRHTYQSLEQRFGETYSMQTYDQYLALANALKDLNRVDAYFVHPYRTDGGKDFVNRMGLNFRYPFMWERSDYTFPYTNEEGWNHYSISNHSEMTSYKAGAGSRNHRGLLDVSFYMHHPLLYGKNNPEVGEPGFNYDTYDFRDAGFFFFADAATDPGTVSRVVVEKPCAGTRIHVSAWVSEFGNSNGNWANVIFNFRAKNKKTGEQKTIHTYVPGKVPDYGYWYHIYFSFIPVISEELTNSEDWEYYISLESNAPSSYGADFAVDDIRIYLQKPEVNLIQLAPLCDPVGGDGEEDVRILVEVPFEMLVRATGLTEAEEADFYFCAIDKDIYEKNKKEEVTESPIINIVNSGSGNPKYGKMTFNVNFEGLPDYAITETDYPVAMKGKNDFGENCMYFFFTVGSKNVKVGQEIKFCVYAQPAGGEVNPEDLLELFQVDDACGIRSELRLQGAAIVKLDGVAVPDRNNIVCCENQRPVVQLTMTARPAEGRDNVEENYDRVIEDAYYDWFDGQYKDLVDAGLEEALSHFREVYPLAETFEMAPERTYTQEDSTLIAEYCNKGTLHLRQSFYIFPEYHLAEGEESIKVYATALPIYIPEPGNIHELLCLSPVEVPMTIRNQAPVMLHGLSMEYPERMKDVPLRVGLEQIRSARGDNGNPLWLPVRTVSPVTENVTTLVRPEQNKAAYFRLPDQYVYLVGSNDPRYQSLSPDSPDYNADEDKYGEFSGLLEVGEVENLIAEKGRVVGNFVGIRFNEKFDPREGYYYVLRYSFEENQKQVGNAYFGVDAPCYGEDVLTLKIVPEYQMWIGKDGNFNNDANWRRVTADELLAESTDGITDLVILDEVNANRASYVPMDFTKVIVPAVTEDSEPGAVLSIDNLAVVDQSYTPYGSSAQLTAKFASEYAGDIKYDMVAFVDDAGVQCRPWYHNTCREIHFNFGAEILNQGALVYQRAWLDLDNVPGSWYYLSLPLQETFAGDMYLPRTTGAVQKTRLFSDITFAGPDNDHLHDRFLPAVYQRAWNKSSAKIYDMHSEGLGQDSGDHPDLDRNVAVTADWSRVYNDVLEKYAPDTNPGFSIRTDVGYMADADDIETVRFRLPKADTFYEYWDQTGTNSGHKTDILRKANYRLNPSEGTMTATAAEPSRYFLVGNPFMCHLDMQQFFADNDAIQHKCWIMNNGELKAIDYMMFDRGDESTEWRYLPPFQGFFVEILGDVPVKSLTLKYNQDMMAALNGDNLLTLSARDPQLGTNNILVTMTAPGERDSQLRFVVGESAPDGDVAAIFNADSEHGMTAFSKLEGLASSIRYVDAMSREEVGVTVRDNKPVTLRFDGEAVDGLLLRDLLTGVDTELYDGMEYEVEGSVSGRLYIVSPASGVEDAIALSDFSLEISGSRVALTAPAGTSSVAMQVFDTDGRLITNSLANSARVEVNLNAGYYIISAVTDLGAKFSSKIMVRK